MLLTRILLVDDEVIFRDFLKGLLDWPSYGFLICGEAANGIQAKQLVAETRPHIVLTDICMDEVDGLSLIEFLNKNYRDVQIIVLSGYDEYEYVRTSMKSGVLDYLLKHRITSDSLLAVLRSAEEKIAHQDLELQESIHTARQRAQGQILLRQSFLQSFLLGELEDRTEIENKIREFSLPMTNHSVLIVVAAIDRMSQHKLIYSEEQWRALFGRVVDIVDTVVAEMIGGVVVPLADSQFVVLVCKKKPISHLFVFNQAENCIRQIRMDLKMHCNITACYSVSAVLDDIYQIPAVFATTRLALGNRIYLDYDMLISENTYPTSQKEHYNISISDEHNLHQLLQSSDKPGLLSYVELIFENCRRCHLDEARLRIIMAEMLNLLNRELRSIELDIMDIYPSYHKVFEQIHSMTLNEMRDWLLDCYSKVFDAKAKRRFTDASRTVTQQACSYIDRHFADNISSSSIAETIGVSPSYLSRVFKHDTNRTVIEYLNSVRIEQAKKMIEDGARLSVLAQQSGFNSNTYFFTVFKRSTGKTPKEYRKMIENKMEDEHE